MTAPAAPAPGTTTTARTTTTSTATRARAKMAVPALLLMIGSILSFILALVLAAGGFILGMNTLDEDEQVAGFVYGAIGTVMVPYFAVMAVGSARMKNLRSYGLAMTTAIMAISSILCIGLCGLFVMPVGIWALIVLVDPDVKRQFNRSKYRADDYDDGR